MEPGMTRCEIMAEDGQGITTKQVADRIYEDCKAIADALLTFRAVVRASDHGRDFIEHLFETDDLLDHRKNPHDALNEWAMHCAEAAQ